MNVLKDFLNNPKRFLKGNSKFELDQDVRSPTSDRTNDERFIFFFADARFQTTMPPLSPFAQLLGSKSLFEN